MSTLPTDSPSPAGGAERVCPECGLHTALSNCPSDGEMTIILAKREPAAADRVGQIISGRYKILAVIGQGGFGAVYKAHHTATGDTVAIKVLRTDVAGSLDTVGRFRQEAKQTSKLKHPNTVRVFDFGQMDDGELFLAMEFLEGRTLTDLLAKEAPLDPKRLVHIAAQVLKSLSEAHAKGLVHRDLKPDNIFLQTVHGEPDFAKVLDFGIAKSVGGDSTKDMTSAGAIIGTPRYMSPEQARGQTVDLRTDLYSLGIILHESLTGTTPFTADSPLSMLLRRVQEEPPRVHDGLAIATPKGICDAVYRAICRDKEGRFAHADEMAAALLAGLATPLLPPRARVPSADSGADSDSDAATGLQARPATPGQSGSTGKVVVSAAEDELGPTLSEADSAELKAAMAAQPVAAPATVAEPAHPQQEETLHAGPQSAQTPQPAAPPTPTGGSQDQAAPGPDGQRPAGGPLSGRPRARRIWVGVGIAVVTLLAVTAAISTGGSHRAPPAAQPEGASAAAPAVAPPPTILPVAPVAPQPAATPGPASAPQDVTAVATGPAGGQPTVIRVIVEPADAAIEIDGAPIAGHESAVSVGKHAIRASKAGWAPQAMEVDAMAGANTIRLALKKSGSEGKRTAPVGEGKRPTPSDKDDGALLIK